MLDIGRFAADGVGVKSDNIVKSIQYVTGTGTVTLDHGVDKEASLAVRLSSNVGAPSVDYSMNIPSISSDGLSVVMSSNSGNQLVMVIEFYSRFIKSYQTGSFSVSSASGDNPLTTAISTVVPDNSILVFSGGYSYYDTPSGAYRLSAVYTTDISLNASSIVATFGKNNDILRNENFTYIVLEFMDSVI